MYHDKQNDLPINEKAVPDNMKKATKLGLAVFTAKALSVNLNISMKLLTKFFVKMQIKSCITLFS